MELYNISKHWYVKQAFPSFLPKGLLVIDYEILHGTGAVCLAAFNFFCGQTRCVVGRAEDRGAWRV